jgi:hypothetical protein
MLQISADITSFISALKPVVSLQLIANEPKLQICLIKQMEVPDVAGNLHKLPKHNQQPITNNR